MSPGIALRIDGYPLLAAQLTAKQLTYRATRKIGCIAPRVRRTVQDSLLCRWGLGSMLRKVAPAHVRKLLRSPFDFIAQLATTRWSSDSRTPRCGAEQAANSTTLLFALTAQSNTAFPSG